MPEHPITRYYIERLLLDILKTAEGFTGSKSPAAARDRRRLTRRGLELVDLAITTELLPPHCRNFYVEKLQTLSY